MSNINSYGWPDTISGTQIPQPDPQVIEQIVGGFVGNKKKTIFITGITGFLGRNLSKYIWYNYKNKYNIIGIGISPNKISNFKNIRRSWGATYHDIPIHLIDIVHDNHKLEQIFKDNKIDYVIHCAALKYIDIANKQPEQTINININGTLNILKLCKKYNIENLIALSTDKANKPINTYGMTKFLMEELVKTYNYTIYQGVNFFWSDGSVLDVWYRQIKKKEDLCVTNFNHERHYSTIKDICKDLINNLDNKNAFLTPSHIFKIKLLDLFNSFVKYFDYDTSKCFIMGERDNEKFIEDLTNEKKYKNLTEVEITQYIKNEIENGELSVV